MMRHQVTQDNQYYYYRFVLRIAPTGINSWDPVPSDPALRMDVVVGNLVDNSTLIKVISTRRYA